ncbi:MAG: efflux RND transporter periplasmic adaptor subunit [Hyphomicrobiales bacterium]|nr:efflux RND transporter periplasmic adaptor subunit [Hyphomicrobiales bacterium]
MLTKIDQKNISTDDAVPVGAGQKVHDSVSINEDNWTPEGSVTSEKGHSKSSIFFRVTIQIVLMGLILFGSFLAMNRLINAKPEIRKRPSFRTVYTVETVPVVLGDNRPKFTVYGEAVASRTVDLRSLVSGEVIWVNEKLKTGARMEKGDELVEIDDFQFKGALREAQANRDEVLARIKENESRIALEKARSQRLTEQLELSRSDHKRISGLRAKGTSTQKQLDDRAMSVSQRAQAAEQSQSNLQAEKAKLEQQNASLARLNWRGELAKRNLFNTMLKAPFDGVVRSTGAEAGRTVNANDIVVSLYEDKKMDIRFTLTDKRYGRLQSDKNGVLGRQVKIIWAIGTQKFTYPATVERIGAEISSSRGGVEVLASLQQVVGNPTIRPGAFVEIYVPDVLFAKSAIVPESAIYHGNSVYLKKDGKLVSKAVKVMAYDGDSTIISGKIQNGDKILITRIAEISDGLRVREEGDVIPNKRRAKPNKKNGKGN